MKLVSWNVNGFRAVLGKGFAEIFDNFDADIFCLQETKMQPGQAEFAPEGYFQYWNSAEKKGYSGTAVFTRVEPMSVVFGIGEKHLDEGRVITLEFEDEAFEAIARLAIERNTGARGLRSIIEGVMMRPMYDLPGRDDVERAIVTAAFVRGDEELKLITN